MKLKNKGLQGMKFLDTRTSDEVKEKVVVAQAWF